VNLVKSYMAEFPPLKHLTLVLKHLLFVCSMNDTYSGGLSSYGIILMIMSFLKVFIQFYLLTKKHVKISYLNPLISKD